MTEVTALDKVPRDFRLALACSMIKHFLTFFSADNSNIGGSKAWIRQKGPRTRLGDKDCSAIIAFTGSEFVP